MLNRTLCDVLEEMRQLDKTRNYSYLPGLIEEAQSMGNRMEAKLYDVKDLERVRETAKAKREEVKKLEEQIAELRKKKKNNANL